MADHLQMHGVRSHLSTRGMAIRKDNGEYIVTHNDHRWPDSVRTADLMAAYTSGLRMASIRESSNDIQRQGGRA